MRQPIRGRFAGRGYRARFVSLVILMLGPLLLNITGLYDDISVYGLSVTLVLFALCFVKLPGAHRDAFIRYALWVCGFSFLLHLAYELLHSVYFTHFTEPGYSYAELVEMLVVAAYADGLISLILLFCLTLLYPGAWRKPLPGKHAGVVLMMAAAIQLVIEVYALQTGDWAYTEAMPMIPFVNVGLTPVIQMPLLILPALWLALQMTNQTPDSCGSV